MGALGHYVTPDMMVVAPDLISRWLEYELKQILTGDCESMCPGEIQLFQSPQQPV